MHTKRFSLAITCLAALMLVFVTVTATGCSARKSEQYRRQADTLYGLGKYEEAARAYQRSAETDPQNTLAKVGLARCYLRQGDQDKAVAKLLEATQDQPPVEVAFLEAVPLLLRLGRSEEASQLASRLTESDEERGKILEAHVLRETNRLDEAIALLESLLTKFPDSEEVRISLSADYLLAGTPEKAESVLKDLVDRLDTVSTATHMALVKVYQVQGKIEQVIDLFEDLVAKNPDDVKLKLGLAQSLLSANRVDAAEKIARELYEKDPESGWVNSLLGSCLMEKGEYTDAIPYLQKAAAQLPNEKDIARKLAVVRGAPTPGAPTRRTPTQATQIASDASAEDLLKLGAVRTLLGRADLIVPGASQDTLNSLALAAFIAQDQERLEQFLSTLPEDAPMRKCINLAQAHDLQGLVDFIPTWQESEPYAQVLRDNACAFSLALLGGRAQALNLLNQSITQTPDYGISLLTLAHVFYMSGMPEAAARSLELLLNRNVGVMETHSLLYSFLRDARMYDEARRIAESTFSLFPRDQEAILNLAQAYLDAGENELAVQLLERGVSAHPNEPLMRVALARGLVRTDRSKEALDLLDESLDSPELSAQNTVTAAFAYASLGQWDQVQQRLAQLSGTPSQSVSTDLLIVAADLHTGKRDQAASLFSACMSKIEMGRPLADTIASALGVADIPADPDEAALVKKLAANNDALGTLVYAVACMEARMFAQSLTLLEKIRQEQGASPRLIQALYTCLPETVEGDALHTRSTLLAQSNPDLPATWLGVAAVETRLGNSQAAEEAYTKAQNLDPKNPVIWQSTGHYYESQGDYAKAAQAYAKVLESAPDNAAAHNNLAYSLLMSKGDLNTALAHAEKAQSLRPTDPYILHTLGVVQLELGNLEESRKYLSIALELRPGNPIFLYDYGRLLLKRGDTEEGIKHIEMAVQYSERLNLPFERIEEAKALLAAQQPAGDEG